MVPATEAVIPADNGTFRYGYGLFETMLITDGAIRLGHYHWERLLKGAELISFELPALMTANRLEERVLKLAAKNKLAHLCRIRLQLYAAGGGLYGLTTPQPAYIIECFPVEEGTRDMNDHGLVTGIADGVAKSPDMLSNLKSCNSLVYAIAARQAKAMRWNDSLIRNTNGNIIESTIANIFWIKNGVVHTPPLADGCVAGVMRRHVLQTLGNVSETQLTDEALLDADEVFLTNAIKKIRWVGDIAGRMYGNRIVREINSIL